MDDASQHLEIFQLRDETVDKKKFTDLLAHGQVLSDLKPDIQWVVDIWKNNAVE